MRIDPDEWQVCRDQLTAGYKENDNNDNQLHRYAPRR